MKTEEKEERDLNIILQELISKISKKLPEIKNLCEKNNGEVIFDIVASFDDIIHELRFDYQQKSIDFLIEPEVENGSNTLFLEM